MRARLANWLARAWASPPQPPPRCAIALAIAETLYRSAIRMRRFAPVHAALPVVSVGSILVGGAGKTPLASALARLAHEEGMHPAILLRGYGRRGRGGGARVPSAIGAAEVAEFGDEACLHARSGAAAVYVGADRRESAERAAADGCTLAILDDGMQHRGLARDFEIVTLPAENPIGNGRLLPRGPLREPQTALARADLIVLAHSAASVPPPETLAIIRRNAPRTATLSWKGGLALRPLSGRMPPPSGTVALLTGVGRPDSFRRAVERAGHRVAWEATFPDHHRFRQREIEAVRRRARADRIEWVLTTAKDEMRLLEIDLGEAPAFCCADLSLAWNDPGAESQLRALLRRIESEH
jgi:tetraacyldisaccharide 4'-kinase